MTDIHTFLNRFQLQYRRTTTLHKVVIAAAVVLSSVTLLSIRMVLLEEEQKLLDLQHQAAVLEQENNALRRDIEELGTVDAIRRIGQEELGLVDPDTIIFEQAD